MDYDLVEIRVGKDQVLVFDFTGASVGACGRFEGDPSTIPAKILARAGRHARFRRIVGMHRAGLLTDGDYAALRGC